MRPLIRLCLLLAAMLPGAVQAEDRVALVIGNSNYSYIRPLANAAQDAQDVSGALQSLGFRVFEGIDLTREQTGLLIHRALSAMDDDDVALLYFAGHGIQIGAQNYMLPTDAVGHNEADYRTSAISLQNLLGDMERRAKRNIVILDACRDNPFNDQPATRSLSGSTRSAQPDGLAEVKAGVSSFIAFATEPGSVASDGGGRNSPFTAAFLRHVRTEADDLHELMRKVRRDVVEETGRQQIPWENSSLIERIYLAHPGGRRAATAALASPVPQPAFPQPAARTGFEMTHVVSGLDPNGDGFLALRSGTYGGAPLLAKMAEGVRLRFLGQEGVWFNVATENGLQGWAHSNWIRFTGAAQATAAVPRAPAAASCEALWHQRNSYFHRRGYCFQSARGQAAFSNASCIPGLSAANVPLSSAERAAVSQIKSQEQAMGCR